MESEAAGEGDLGGESGHPTGYTWAVDIMDEGTYLRQLERRSTWGVAILVTYVLGGTALLIVEARLWGADLESMLYCATAVYIPGALIGVIVWRFLRGDTQVADARFYLDKAGFEGWMQSGALLGMLRAALESRGIPFALEQRSPTSHRLKFPSGMTLDLYAREIPSDPRARYTYSGAFTLSGVRGVGVAVARDVQAAIGTLPTVGPPRRPPEDEPASGLDTGVYDPSYSWD